MNYLRPSIQRLKLPIPIRNTPTPTTTGNTPTATPTPTITGNTPTATPTLVAAAYNNVGTSDDLYPATGSFDNLGRSYSAQALQAVGIVPGQTFYSDGIAYTWPSPPSGNHNNNYIANGQTVPVTTPVANAVKLGFLGASTYANVSGTAIINYTDDSHQSFTLGMSDWQLAQNTTSQPAYGNQIVATAAYLNGPSGKNLKGYIFSAEVDLQQDKTIQSVTLPPLPSNGFMHIFSLGTRAATPYNNVGISDDAYPQSGNFDGVSNSNYAANNSYSDQALQAAGLTHGKTVACNGVTFSWPNVRDGQYDNYQANEQTIPVTSVANATTLAFLGAASNGTSTGTGTITYTDGNTQNFTLSLSDWAASPAADGNSVVATMRHRNTPAGKQQSVPVYVFYTDVTLQASKMVQSVTLPPYGIGGQLHVFAIGTK